MASGPHLQEEAREGERHERNHGAEGSDEGVVQGVFHRAEMKQIQKSTSSH